MPRLVLQKAFFELTIAFAHRLGQVSSLSLAEAVARHTPLTYIIYWPPPYVESNPYRQKLLKGLEAEGDPAAWCHAYFLERETDRPPMKGPLFGCFWYYHNATQQTVRLHFNGSGRQESALSSRSQAARRSELAALFAHVRKNHPGARRVRGSSWLYNIEAYCRLFPPEYVSRAVPAGYPLHRMALWGQLIDRTGEPRQSMAAPFLTRLSSAATAEECAACFPYQVLDINAPLELMLPNDSRSQN